LLAKAAFPAEDIRHLAARSTRTALFLKNGVDPMKHATLFQVVIVGFGLIGTTAAFGSAAMEELHRQMLKVGDQITECADFSGTWKGTCETKNLLDPTAAPESKEETMTFKQFECAALQSEVFGVAMIGVSATKTVSSERGTMSEKGGVWWEEKGQKLGMAGDFYLGLYGKDGVMRQGYIKAAYTREGDAIVGASTNKIKAIDAHGGMTILTHEESSCRLELQR